MVEDATEKVQCRSAEYPLEVEDLECAWYREPEIATRSSVCAFSVKAMVRSQACAEKKLPFSTHVNPTYTK